MSAHPPRPKALLILGMHRSGTSAVTRAVNLLGAHIGSKILLPGAGNSEGFWEHADAMHINHDLLTAFGHSWFDIRQLPPDWLQQPAAQDALVRIETVIRNEFAAYPLVALKDPRICLTAPLWIRAFETLGYDVQCLLVVRDPREVADSLQAREQWPREPIFLLWAHYMMEAVLATREHTRALITYDQLLDDWRDTLHRVASALTLAWPRGESAAGADIDAFLHSGHRHHVAAAQTGDDALLDGMPPFVAEFYGNCLALAEGRGEWAAVDRAALTMHSISDLYTPHLGNLQSQHKEMEQQLTAKLKAYEDLLKNIVAKLQPKS